MNAIIHFIKSERKNILAGIGVSIVITFLFTGFHHKMEAILLNLIYGILVGLSIAIGCGAISKKMFQSNRWLEKPVKRYISTVLMITIYIILDVILLNLIWFKITQDANPNVLFRSNLFLVIMAIELVIGLLIYMIILSRYFAINLNSYYLQAQKSEQDLAKYRFETLKNQVNPHFLFNSLNVLSGIIHKEANLADEFILRLSSIYRYVLDVQEEDVVELKSELAFTEDYLYLLKIRFGKMFSYEISVGGEGYVIPMALQILVENALKHNAMLSDKILQITISDKEDYLIVRNTRNQNFSESPSTGLGLENIKKRYAHLTNQEVIIASTADCFEVRIPILKLKMTP